ncbi:hypothetical protein BCR37DRAFT_162964 [Protomyces lactucae-debilis]|uniref:DUF7727 domain-containing protein n=1 Tax=Protomyces lactucae-debilis TaxID=2754530 RepID=A0A1Y2EYP1_PROLT|nr:uncharacterized protein BCR37DRAFT_162964 [Protomyces lactucae-debilis]ORY76703.1 hypothetical protein BCR37DRAFT_162964 [Protomyces lactucae-debilis]
MPLIKSDLANTVIILGGIYQVYAAVWAIFYPRAFCTFITKVLEPLVAPIPILQITNIIVGTVVVSAEILSTFKPLNRFILLKVIFYTAAGVPAFLLLNTVNAAAILWYGAMLLAWGYWDGEARIDVKIQA